MPETTEHTLEGQTLRFHPVEVLAKSGAFSSRGPQSAGFKKNSAVSKDSVRGPLGTFGTSEKSVTLERGFLRWSDLASLRGSSEDLRGEGQDNAQLLYVLPLPVTPRFPPPQVSVCKAAGPVSCAPEHQQHLWTPGPAQPGVSARTPLLRDICSCLPSPPRHTGLGRASVGARGRGQDKGSPTVPRNAYGNNCLFTQSWGAGAATG